MYDCIIIGGGPGGYLAAERAGAAGLSTLIIEKETLGGVCLNWGCIPTKTLLAAAKRYTHALDSAQYGVKAEKVTFDLTAAMAWKDRIVKTLVKGVEYQMKRHGVTVVKGEGVLKGGNRVRVGSEIFEGKNIIIATGSSPAIPPIPGVETAMTSREILSLDKLPGSLAVIGGGVIGLEFATFFHTLGVEVHVIEMLPEIVPSVDAEIAGLLRKSLSGIDFRLGCRVTGISGGSVSFRTDGGEESVKADTVLVSVGRRPNVGGIGLEEVGIDFGPGGIRVDDRMRTNLPGVYAVGDVTGKSLLAHSAYRMAEVAVDSMTGGRQRMRYRAVPYVVYTHPEAAGCGLTEEGAKAEGRECRVAKLQMRANGRFIAENPGENGLCKVIIDSRTDTVIGIHILGGVSSEMAYGAAAIVERELTVGDVKEIIFPHPTVSEIIKDTLWESH